MSPGPEATFDVNELPERIAEKIDIANDGCWHWAAATSQKGYGIIQIVRSNESERGYAHRAIWELLVGQIPDGLQIAHRCFVRRCVNPTHLAAVTPAERTRMMIDAGRHWKQKVAACPAGHPYNEANTYVYPNGARLCRTCNTARWRTSRARKKELEATAANP